MVDYISREAAIEALKKERDYTGKFTFEEEHAWAVGFQQGITFALSDVAAIPAADVRPVVLGKWEHFGSDVFRCSECGYGILPWNVGVNFCPNCGADMRQTGDENV